MADTLPDLLSTRQQLASQLAELDQKIRAQQQAARQKIIQELRATMAQHGVTVAELSDGKVLSKPTGPRAGRKVAAKYRDPASGKTWSGRGIKPRWMSEALTTGKKVEDFAI